MIGACITLAIIFLVACAFAKDLYDAQWAIVACFALLFATWVARKWVRAPILVMAFYLGTSAIWTAAYGAGGPAGMFTVMLTIRQTMFLGIVLCGAAAVGAMPVRIMHWLLPAAAISSLVGWAPINHNTSLNACLLVACLPFARTWTTLALVAAVVFLRQDGGMAPILLAAYVTLLVGHLWALAMVAGAGILGFQWWRFPYFMNESSRFQFYKLTWAYFRENVVQWHGAGLGTFIFHGPKLQAAAKFEIHERVMNTPWWLSLHSDWGQLLFETGWVGLVLGLWVYIDSLIVADRPTRQSLLLMGMCGVGYFPMQVPIMAFVCVWLAVRAQWRPK